MLKYPIYVISKNRPNAKTARVLESMKIDYKICVEPEECDLYLKNFKEENELTV